MLEQFGSATPSELVSYLRLLINASYHLKWVSLELVQHMPMLLGLSCEHYLVLLYINKIKVP
jgi:hypothetical protein